jgi:hypothetical protein
LKAALAELTAFKSGRKYEDMKKEHQKEKNCLERTLEAVRQELAMAHKNAITARNNWFQVFEDIEKEFKKKLGKIQTELKSVKEEMFKILREKDAALDKVKELRLKLYETETLLEDERGKNLTLRSQINRDHENSSLPSSTTRTKRKKITNNREVSGKKRGGQPGHEGHRRKRQEPTMEPVLLDPPQKVLEDPDFKKTKKTITKQLVNIRLVLEVTDYQADVYYNSKTGERVHAKFPAGIVNDVNYGGSIKAAAFLLNHDCRVSIDKCGEFLSDLTGGRLNLSNGMISHLSKEFAGKSQKELKAAFADLLLVPVMHTDFTATRLDGKHVQILICAEPDGKALYFARKQKGHEGIKDSPVETYQGILVHDHDTTLYRYGSDHQECLAHVLRYLKDSIENEPGRTWSTLMRGHLQAGIHYINSLTEESEWDEGWVRDFETRYREILQTAKKEYDYIPANEYYKDGYNLYLRLEKYMGNHLLFLHNLDVPATNNTAERLLRVWKRKQAQAVTFRSFDSIDYLCQCMSMLFMMRQEDGNLFERVAQVFG